jgi:hypothetical protein
LLPFSSLVASLLWMFLNEFPISWERKASSKDLGHNLKIYIYYRILSSGKIILKLTLMQLYTIKYYSNMY